MIATSPVSAPACSILFGAAKITLDLRRVVFGWRRRPRRSHFEPLPAHLVIGRELGRGALEDDLAMAHDVEPARDGERDGELLLDQQNGRAAPRDLAEQDADLLDQPR